MKFAKLNMMPSSSSLRFPLTLTLSRREREQQPNVFGFADSRGSISESRPPNSLRITLPLPVGEGRGEGTTRNGLS